MTGVVVGVLVGLSAIVGGPRWLRIAQREHYLPGSVTRFAFRWWRSSPLNVGLGLLAVALVALSAVNLWEATIACGVVNLLAPVGLGFRGRSSRLAFTRRTRTLAATAGALVVVVTALGVWVWTAPFVTSAALCCVAPAVVDVALALLAPLEKRASERYVRQAGRRLREVAPRIVAITGSYGKTSTKLLVGHLLAEKFTTVVSPASYNNRLGLARAVNERLDAGTEVFVAEMGTYGVGEIRELCQWLKPDVGVITAIGPVHLERMGSIETIVKAKSEILEDAASVVVNVDATGISALADKYADAGRTVVRCSSIDENATVYVKADADLLRVHVAGREIASAPADTTFPTNLAAAVGVAIAMGIPESAIGNRLVSFPRAEHRQTVGRTASGVTVIDDTYNSNPEGSSAALRTLGLVGATGRRVVVTPGMVELGREQRRANEEFGRQAAAVATDLLIVGRTNLAALRRGALASNNGDARSADGARVHLFRHREQAVAWVRSNLDDGDAVLYENDLPDHYP